MPAAHFLGLRPRLVFAQYPDDLLLAEATPFHRPSPFSGDGLYLISAEFSGCRPPPLVDRLGQHHRGPGSQRTLAPSATTHHELLFAVEPIELLVIHRVPFALKHPAQAPIPEAPPLGGQLAQPLSDLLRRMRGRLAATHTHSPCFARPI